MSSALILSLAGLVVPAIVSFLNGWVSRAKDAVAAEQRGADKVTTAVNKESSDAQARMSAANAAPRSGDISIGRLRDGTF